MVSRNFLKNLVAKNLIECHSLHPPSPTKYYNVFGFNKNKCILPQNGCAWCFGNGSG